MARCRYIPIAMIVVGLSLVGAQPALAQSSSVVQRLVRFGRMDRRTAQQTARVVHARMTENGRTGGTEYDPMRQALGLAMFGGPGSTRPEYDARLRQVVDRLSRGLTDETLEGLFRPGPGVGLRCAQLFAIPMSQCDALVAAAGSQEADLPYIPPDDAEALREELTGAGIDGGLARDAVRALTATLLSVPSTADASPRGRRLARLLRECPGGLSDEESQVRAWHMGATSGMVRCLVSAVGREGRAAPSVLTEVFGVGDAAVPLLRWAHGQPQVAARPAPPPPPTRDQVMAQATAHYRAGRFAEAANVYAQVAQREPGFAPAQQGLAVSRMRAGDPRGAAEAYRAAARLEPTNASVQVGLARALTASGDREGAAAAYRLALALEPNNAAAQRELRALAPPPDPTVAMREEARQHFRARHFDRAADVYRRITQMRASDASAYAGLGASLLAGRDARGAVAAYRRAVELDPSSAGFFAALGAAEEAAGNRPGAIGAYRRALALDSSMRPAREALARLEPAPSRGGASVLPSTVPTAPQQPPAPVGPALPETPSRDDIVRTMLPYQPRLEACAPSIGGTVVFHLVILGERGSVSEVQLTGEHAGTDEAGCMESHLMGARFPRFSRERIEISYPFQLEGPPETPPDAEP